MSLRAADPAQSFDGDSSKKMRFRASSAYLYLAIISIAFHGYVFLYVTNVISYEIFPRMTDFGAPQLFAGAVAYACAMIFFSALLLFFSMSSVTIDQNCIAKQQPFYPYTVIRWSDVRTALVFPRYGRVVISDGREKITVTHYYVNFGLLKRLIVMRLIENGVNFASQ